MADLVTELHDEATEQIKQIRAYRTYQGTNNTEYKAKAKIAIGVIGAYVRLRATMANEQSNRLIEARILGDSPDTKRLTA
jgi:carbon monoxide dehydrogenase subunit G